jgi:hypothetical protein
MILNSTWTLHRSSIIKIRIIFCRSKSSQSMSTIIAERNVGDKYMGVPSSPNSGRMRPLLPPVDAPLVRKYSNTVAQVWSYTKHYRYVVLLKMLRKYLKIHKLVYRYCSVRYVSYSTCHRLEISTWLDTMWSETFLFERVHNDDRVKLLLKVAIFC